MNCICFGFSYLQILNLKRSCRMCWKFDHIRLILVGFLHLKKAGDSSVQNVCIRNGFMLFKGGRRTEAPCQFKVILVIGVSHC